MNEILKELSERKSVRVFEERPIPKEAKEAILNAAAQAPTAGNQQLYTIIDVTSSEIKEELVKTCDNQPFIAKAPLVLIFCADCLKWQDAYIEAGCSPHDPGVGDLIISVLDAAIAAQNAVTAAHSLGIGSCYIGDVIENCERQREILGLPKYVLPAVMLVFGYPTSGQKERKKPERFALNDIVCENKYKRKSGDELRKMFEKRCGAQGFETWVGKYCERKHNSDFSIEMTRSALEYLKDFTQ